MIYLILLTTYVKCLEKSNLVLRFFIVKEEYIKSSKKEIKARRFPWTLEAHFQFLDPELLSTCWQEILCFWLNLHIP